MAQKEWQKIHREVGQHRRIEQFCLLVCWENEGSDHRIRQYLKVFYKAKQEILRFLKSKMLHPRQKVRGEEWWNGQKALMSYDGGVPTYKT